MPRVHSDLDVYLAEDLAYTGTRIVEDPNNKRLVVKTTTPNTRTWEVSLVLTDVSAERIDRTTFRWTGLDPEGQTVVATGVHRKPLCCGR